MAFRTTIEYLDGKVRVIETRHMIRPDGVAQVYRILREERTPAPEISAHAFSTKSVEETVPYCVVRGVTTDIVGSER